MSLRHSFLGLFGLLGLFGFFPESLSAQTIPDTFTLRHQHHLFAIAAKDRKTWQSPQEIWLLNGQEITPPSSLLVDGDNPPPLPEGVVRSVKIGWNISAIQATLLQKVAPLLNRNPGAVTIRRSSGAVVFTGVGLPGRKLDLTASAELIARGLEQGVSDVWLAVETTPPSITVLDSELATLGIKEVVTVGESDMSNSPPNRIYNIGVGLRKFNGHLIQQGETFSFLKVLGPVDGTTGYKKELVIKGDKTVPDFGGGLCQVSTTAYRGVWEYGFPIVKRQNHSYVVNHYTPYGTDATVYTSGPDMQFLNDSPGALLMQTYQEGDFAYFIYYGTRDDRSAKIVGPFVWDRVSPPPSKTEYTTEIPAGTRRKVGDAVPGLKAMWYRIVQKDGEETIESVFSWYSARPLFYQIGVEGLPTGSGELLQPGDVVGSL